MFGEKTTLVKDNAYSWYLRGYCFCFVRGYRPCSGTYLIEVKGI